MSDSSSPSLSYKDAGVDIDAGNELVERIKPAIKRTHRAGCVGTVGGFGGLFELPMLPTQPARWVRLIAGLIRSTSSLPASISTPASL